MIKIIEADKPELDRVFEILDWLVREHKPGYVYDKFIKLNYKTSYDHASCWYLDNDGNPSCIVGHVLKALGWTTEEIASIEGSIPTHGLPGAQPLPKYEDAVVLWHRLRPPTLQFLGMVQGLQDAGESWDEAVSYAHKTRAYEEANQ